MYYNNNIQLLFLKGVYIMKFELVADASVDITKDISDMASKKAQGKRVPGSLDACTCTGNCE